MIPDWAQRESEGVGFLDAITSTPSDDGVLFDPAPNDSSGETSSSFASQLASEDPGCHQSAEQPTFEHAEYFESMGVDVQNELVMCGSPHLDACEEDIRAKVKSGKLTTAQGSAVSATLSRRLTIIQGPPGTGKTTTSVEVPRHRLHTGICVTLALHRFFVSGHRG